MRKNATAKVQKKIQKKTKNFSSEEIKLPLQEAGQVFLYDTTDADVEGIIGAMEYGEGLVKLRNKFDQEIHEFSRRFGVKADVRVLLTIRNTLKE